MKAAILRTERKPCQNLKSLFLLFRKPLFDEGEMHFFVQIAAFPPSFLHASSVEELGFMTFSGHSPSALSPSTPHNLGCEKQV